MGAAHPESPSPSTTITPKDAKQERVKRYNPYLKILDQRFENQRFDLNFFDGAKSTITVPIESMDGYPSERDLAQRAIVVLAGIEIMLLPFAAIEGMYLLGIALAVLLSTLFAMVLILVLHLQILVSDLKVANEGIFNHNFEGKARAVRTLIHNFKRILSWRRFFRYTVFGAGLAFAVIVAVLYARLAGGYQRTMVLNGAICFAALAIYIVILNLFRRRYTKGVDPTLALVLMVEETGKQLYAARRQFPETPFGPSPGSGYDPGGSDGAEQATPTDRDN